MEGTNVNLLREDELVANLQLYEDKKYYDRANFFVTAQGMFFSAFAVLVAGSNNLTGLIKMIPAVICITGILLNVIWGYSSMIQIEKILALEKVRNKSFKTFADSNNVTKTVAEFNRITNAPTITDLIYKWAPALLGVAWVAMLAFYAVQLTVGIKI